jgi:hypothetical protein
MIVSKNKTVTSKMAVISTDNSQHSVEWEWRNPLKKGMALRRFLHAQPPLLYGCPVEMNSAVKAMGGLFKALPLLLLKT